MNIPFLQGYLPVSSGQLVEHTFWLAGRGRVTSTGRVIGVSIHPTRRQDIYVVEFPLTEPNGENVIRNVNSGKEFAD